MAAFVCITGGQIHKSAAADGGQKTNCYGQIHFENVPFRKRGNHEATMAYPCGYPYIVDSCMVTAYDAPLRAKRLAVGLFDAKGSLCGADTYCAAPQCDA